MTSLTLGKLRHLHQLANESGMFTIAALDHRGSFEKALRTTLGQDTLTWETVVEEKVRLIRALAPHASAVLLDPVYSAGPLIARGVLPGQAGLLIALEESGYESNTEGRRTKLLPGWNVAAIKRLGGAAVKLLLQYHPEAPVAERQEALLKDVAAECRAHDIPLLVEPICYPITPGQTAKDPDFAKQKPELVVETARRLVPLGIDVLKAEFPTDPTYERDEGRMRAYCRQLSDIGVPWVLLSAGVDFVTFQRQVEIACEEGASGFLAGRAIWKEYTQLTDATARDQFLNTIAVSRLRILADITNYRGTPWTDYLSPAQDPQPGEGWYADYAA